MLFSNLGGYMLKKQQRYIFFPNFPMILWSYISYKI